MGACDELEGNRAQQYSLINDALKFGQKYQEDINSLQASISSFSPSPMKYILNLFFTSLESLLNAFIKSMCPLYDSILERIPIKKVFSKSL